MKITDLLVGEHFLALIAEGKKTRKIIKEGGDRLLQYSSPELENYYSRPAFMQAIPNPLSPAVLCVLFLITYVCGTGGILDYFELSPPIYVLLSFSPMVVMTVLIASIPWAIGRGYTWGLVVILYFYLLELFLTLISFFFISADFFDHSKGLKRFELVPVQLVVFFLTRSIMNGDALSRLVSYCRLRRIAQNAYKIRNNPKDKRKKK